MDIDAVHRLRRRLALWLWAALSASSLWVWRRSLSRLLSLLRSSDEIPSEGMWPTHIIGSECPVCDGPLVIAWREVAGTKHPWRINVEAVTSCDCDGEAMVRAIQEEME